MKEVVETLKNNRYVHGDLRPQNLLQLQDRSVRVVDFDWAGDEGEVHYPLDLNQHCNWHPHVAAGAVIEHSHDSFQLNYLRDPSD